MVIRYSGGEAVRGILLGETEGTLRVAIPGADDILVLHRQTHGRWLTGEHEVVQVELPVSYRPRKAAPKTVNGCLSSSDLDRVIDLMFTSEVAVDVATAVDLVTAAGAGGVV